MTQTSKGIFKPLLLATAALLFLATPSVSFAQRGDGDRGGDRGGRPERQDRGGGGGERGNRGDRGNRGGFDRRGPQQAQQPQQRPDFRGSDRGPSLAQDRDRGGRDFNGPNRQGGRPDFRGNDRRDNGPRFDNRPNGGPRFDNRGPGGPPRAFQGPRRPPEFHARMRNNWRNNYGNWAQRTVWRQNPNWWRGSPFFRDYFGPRVNFYFAPGYGYYNVPAAYYQRSYAPGDYLPAFFLNYEVVDWQSYGLPPPPDGCAWVWVNNNVLLVDAYDGYIMDRIDNVW